MKPPVRVNMISVVKACRNHHVGTISQLKSRLVRPPSTAPPQVRRPRRNPCVDLYFRYPLAERYEDVYSISSHHETLMKQLLPEAWSHNPLTTLKLICNLQVWCGGKHDDEGFYAAAFWLHHNHPKTLASNLVPIAGSFGLIWDVLEILSRVGQRIDDRYYPLTWTRTFRNKNRHSEAQRSKIMRMMRRTSTAKEIRIRETNNNSKNAAENAKEKASALLKRRKGISLANKIAERYNSDPDYRFLHDRVSDLFAECLKHDIQQFNQLQIKQKQRNEQENQEKKNQESFNLKLEITDAARSCPSINSSVPRPTDLLYESIASNIFPPSESESESKSKSMMRLRNEVLVPLRRALQPAFFGKGGNRWGYAPRNALDREPFASGSAIYKYMLQLSKDIYAKRPATIEAGAVLPHRILSYIVKKEGRMERAAELQWERMVEDVYRKQGKLKKCLAVCNVNKWKTSGPTAALGLLVSQLSDDPWKGKVVSYSRNPRLHLIQGKGLKSKCKFMMRMEKEDGRLDEVEEVDLVKVFDLILEVAVNEKLKPEQMIDKVFVFIDKYKHRSSTDLGSSCWKNNAGVDYEQLERRFGDKGYKVPHMVIWNMITMWNELPFCSREPGVTLLSGLEDYSDHLVKSFLDNEGEMGPEQVMEAAISRQDYQTLAVVD